MNEKFLKERYDEWADTFDFSSAQFPNGAKRVTVADDSATAHRDAIGKKYGKECAAYIDEGYAIVSLNYLQAGFYAGYEMACYMLRSMLMVPDHQPAPGEDHERA